MKPTTAYCLSKTENVEKPGVAGKGDRSDLNGQRVVKIDVESVWPSALIGGRGWDRHHCQCINQAVSTFAQGRLDNRRKSGFGRRTTKPYSIRFTCERGFTEPFAASTLSTVFCWLARASTRHILNKDE
ncbi:MAG TPA: hypothetical protein VJ302_16500 [Blastocatellia bacterium]|nr:hypothetical protein [Blastocatellia bacterium]